MDDDRAPDGDNAWDSSLYDDSHSFVYEYGEDLVDLLDPQHGELVLDVGCGTGHLTHHITERGAEVVGIDNARDMVVQAREEYPDLHLVRGDARSLPVKRTFDAVFSNAALHWVPDPDAVVTGVRSALGPDGRFVAEFGGEGNVGTIVETMVEVIQASGYELRDPWYFPGIAEYTALLDRHGLEPRYARLFDRPTTLEGKDGLRDWMAMFTDSFFAAVPPTERDDLVGRIEDRLREELYDPEADAWVADYRRLRVEAHVA